MPEVACDNCGKPVKTTLSKLKKFKHTFCSHECYGAWQRKEKHPSSKPCAICGKPVFAGPTKLEGNVYCSRECFHKAQHKSETRPCEHCGKPVIRRPSEFRKIKHVFCSQDCCNAWRTGRPRPKHGEKVRRALKGRKPSPQCLEASSKAAKKRLNNPEIQAKMQEGLREYYETHPGPNKGRFGSENYNWHGGTAYEPYSEKFNDVLKEQIRNRDNFTCQLCGMSQDEHHERYSRRLAIHHIDYDKKNCHPSNLIALCFACNSKANGNREYHTRLFSEHIAHIEQPELDKP